MASSPASERRARLIREMSRDLNHSRRSPSAESPPAAKRDSTRTTDDMITGSTFDPKNEAVMSTQRAENANNHSPYLRSDVRRFGQYKTPGAEPGTQAAGIARANFEGSHSGLSEDEDMSVEYGRGGRNDTRHTPNTSMQAADLSANAIFSLGNDRSYELLDKAHILAHLNAGKSDRVDKETVRRNQQRHRPASLAKKAMEVASTRPGETAGADVTRVGSDLKNKRRSTLAEMHAKVINEHDDSLLDERPATVSLQVKNTRFSNSKLRQVSKASSAVPSTYIAGQGLDQFSHSRTPQKAQPADLNSRAAPGTATQHSFLLPDLPNITELVSGKWKDGTPVFSRSSKPRSRLVGASTPKQATSGHSNHIPVESIPVPADEKAIFVSLQILKEKIAQLELEKAESDQKLDEYENKLIELKAELDAGEKIRMHSDSALGSTDGEMEKQESNWRVQKSRLESVARSLQNRLERNERKVSASESAVRRITQERDSLIEQLTVAFYNSEELKAENEALQKENETLRQEIDLLRKDHEITRDDKEISRQQPQALKPPVNSSHSKKGKLKETQETLKAKLVQAAMMLDDNINEGGTREGAWRNIAMDREEKHRGSENRPPQEIIEALRNENDALRTRIARFLPQRMDETQRLTSKQADLEQALEEALAEHRIEAAKWSKKEARLRAKIERREEAAREVQSRREDLPRTEHDRCPVKQGKTQSLRGVGGEATLNAQLTGQKAGGSLTKDKKQPEIPERTESNRREATPGASVHGSRTRGKQNIQLQSGSRSHARDHIAGDIGQSRGRASSKPVIESLDETTSDVESTTDLEISKAAVDKATSPDKGSVQPPGADLTYLSFMDADEIARLRRTLEEERAAARRAKHLEAAVQSSTQPRAQVLPRKSSLKDTTRIPETKESSIYLSKSKQERDPNAATQAETKDSETANDKRQDTSTSVLSNVSRRRRSAPTEMTSAFIVPDITMAASNKVHPAFRCTNPEHDPKICTICSPGAPIPEPLPTAAHLPANTDLADVTIRPAQSPPLALATVLKVLSDELAHVKLELAAQEAAYHAHDPAIGQRQRRDLHRRVQELLRAVETRSEVLYKLYDVLEGMPQNAEPLGQKEVEDTLASLGFDIKELGTELGNGKKSVVITSPGMDADAAHDDDMSEQDTGEMPWEGISETGSAIMVQPGRRSVSAF